MHLDKLASYPKYKRGKARGYERATEFLGRKYFPFDAEGIALKLAKKRQAEGDKTNLNLLKQRILREWQLTREIGTEVHSYAEECLTADEVIPHNASNKLITSLALHLKHHFLPRYKALHQEITLRMKDLKIQGTFDALVQDRATGEIILVDFKTGKPLNPSHSFNGQVDYPFQDYPQNSYTNYCVQLNLYRHAIEQIVGGELDGAILVWVGQLHCETFNVPKFPDKVWEEFLKLRKFEVSDEAANMKAIYG